MPMPVAVLIRARIWRSGSGSSFASAMRPSSVDSASNSGGFVSASAAAISVAGSSAEATTGVAVSGSTGSLSYGSAVVSAGRA